MANYFYTYVENHKKSGLVVFELPAIQHVDFVLLLVAVISNRPHCLTAYTPMPSLSVIQIS